MRVIKFLILVLFISVSSLSSFGQSFVFRVLANKGSNQVKRADNGEKIQLSAGLKLMSDDEIIASSGAYIGLMHKSGLTIEVRTAGITSIKELEAKLANSKSSVANKYANFVMNKMNGEEDIHSNYRYNMKATGAVERSSSTAISAMLPTSVHVLSGEMVIRWNSVGEDEAYIITVKNIFDEELYYAESEKPYLAINMNDENMAAEQLIILNIKVKDNEDLFSPDYGIERLSEEKTNTINQALSELKSQVTGNGPLDKLVFASFYEDNGLIIDALTQYEEILEDYPEVEDFKVIYGEFLIRNGLSQIE